MMGELFQMPFPAHGFLFGIKNLIIYQHNRETGPCIFGALSPVVCFYTLLQVVGIATVIGIVCTLDDISIMFHKMIIS